VWATNDPRIAEKIDTAEFRAGISRVEDPLSEKIPAIAKELDDQARKEVGDLSASIAALTQEGLKLAPGRCGKRSKRDDSRSPPRSGSPPGEGVGPGLRFGSETSFDQLLPKDAVPYLLQAWLFRRFRGRIFRGWSAWRTHREISPLSQRGAVISASPGTVPHRGVAIACSALLLAYLFVRP
jgi:hypothetical protein